MAKKKAVIKRGIFLTRNSKGIVVQIHSDNGNKLAVMSGYNNAPNAQKGIQALSVAISSALEKSVEQKNGKWRNTYTVTDLTKPVKKVKK